MSTTISLCVFLPLVPVAAVVLYFRDRRTAERRAEQQFADDVEVWTVTRHRG